MTHEKPKPNEPRLTMIRQCEACRRLGVTLSTFRRNYREYFTQRIPPHQAGRRAAPMFLTDEIDLWITDGPAAVANYRRRLGRLRD